jgi:hypothetical protein
VAGDLNAMHHSHLSSIAPQPVEGAAVAVLHDLVPHTVILPLCSARNQRAAVTPSEGGSSRHDPFVWSCLVLVRI